MILETKHHGKKEYERNDIITFKKGLPGFENLKNFIIFPVEENDVFSVLHSVEDLTLGFILVSPFFVMEDYELELNEDKLQNLEITRPEDVSVFNTVTLSTKMEDITTNLQAPIIINIISKLGEQIILTNEKYKIKYPLLKK